MKKKNQIIILAILFCTLLIYLLTTQMALNYFANKFTQKYNLTYQFIGGSIISGIYINKISYRHRPLADKIDIKYKLTDLLSNHSIKSLKLTKINIENIRNFLDSFPKTTNTTNTLALNLNIDQIFLDFATINLNKIQIYKAKINIKNFTLTPLGIDAYVDGATLSLKSNNQKLYKKLLKNFQLNSLKSKIQFTFKDRCLKATLQSKFSSYFAKNLVLGGNIKYAKDANLSYKGKIHIQKLNNINNNLKKFLENGDVVFDGIDKHLNSSFKSSFIDAKCYSKDIFSLCNIEVASKRIKLKDIIKKVDKKLEAGQFKFKLNSLIKYKDINDTLVKYDIKSNIVNVDGNYTLGKNVYLSNINLPKNSLLTKMGNTHFHPKKLFPIKAKIKQNSSNFKISMQNSNLTLEADYNTKNDQLSAVFDALNAHITILKKGNKIDYTIKTNSLANFLKQLNQIYSMPQNNIDAKLYLKGSLDDSKLKFYITAPQILYKDYLINNFYGEFAISNNQLALKQCSMQSKIFDKKLIVNCKKISKFNLKNKSYSLAICSNLFDANISGIMDKNTIKFQTFLQPKKILLKGIDIKSIKLKTIFDIKNFILKTKANANLSSKYASSISLDTNINYTTKKGFYYDGKTDIKNFKNIDKNLAKLLKDFNISFVGDLKKVTLKANSKQFYLNQFIHNLNTKLKNVKFDFNLESNVAFKEINNSKILYHINSNLIDLDGNYLYKTNGFNFMLKLPKNSIINTLDKKLYTKKLFPIEANGDIKKQDIKLKIKNDKINILVKYLNSNKSLKVKFKGFKASAKIDKTGEKYSYKIDINSIRETKNALADIYKLPKLTVDAQMTIKGVYKNKKNIFSIYAPWFLYQYKIDKVFFIKDSSFNFSYKNGLLLLKSYEAHSYILDRYRKFFSKKISTFDFRKKPYLIDTNINDKIHIKGKVANNIDLNIKTSNFHLLEPEADIYLDANLNYLKDKNISSLNGKVYLLKGIIKYKPKKSYDINDKDIIFVNKEKIRKKEENKKNIFINIMSKKDISYIQNKNRVKFKEDITIYQESGKELKVFGYVKVIEGVYFSDNKKFKIGEGKIMYDGDFLNPFLSLKAYYKKEPYKITIFIGGRLGSPTINFTSDPYLSQNDILSILLFGTKFSLTSNSKNITTNQALALFGNTFAKGIVNSTGIKLDRIQLLSNKEGKMGFLVEKQLTKKFSIIYQNDLIQSIKMKYKHTKHIETDLTFSPDSTGIDIIYK